MSSALLATLVLVLLCESARLWLSGYARSRVLKPLLSGSRHREAQMWFYRAPRWTFPLAVLAWLGSISVVRELFGGFSDNVTSVRHVQAMIASNLLFAACVGLIRLAAEALPGSASAASQQSLGRPGHRPLSGGQRRWSTDAAAWPGPDEPSAGEAPGADVPETAPARRAPAPIAGRANPPAPTPIGQVLWRVQRWKSLRCAVARGVQVFLAAALPVALVRAATLPMVTPETQHELLRLLREGSAEACFWVFVAATITAPLAEELLFRVVIQTGLARWLGVRAAIVTTSLLFAALHGLPDALALFPLALLLGTGYAATGRFLVPFTAHALFNFTNVLLAAFAAV